MEEQYQTQHLATERNGKYPQMSLPIYMASHQDNLREDEVNLRQLLTMLIRRAFVIGGVSLALSASIWSWTLSRQPIYEGQFRLLVEPVTQDQQNKLAELSQIPGVNPKVESTEGLDYDTQIEVLLSPNLMLPIVKQISSRYPDITYDLLLKNLKISRFKETKILEVSYQDPDSEKIQFVLRQLARGFLKYSLQERQTNLRQGIQFVDLQKPTLYARVNSLQKQLQNFRQQHRFLDPEKKAELLSQQASDIQIQRLDTQKQLAQVRAMYVALNSQTGALLAASSAMEFDQTMQKLPDETSSDRSQQQSTVYENLISKLRDLETQLAASSAKFQADNPTIESLKKQRDSLFPVLRQEATRVLNNRIVHVKNQISLLEVSAAKIAQTENTFNQTIEQLPVLARQYTDLQRELNIATESLNRFLEKRESLQIEMAQKEVPWQTLAQPQLSEAPIFPNVPRFLVLGTIASILAGIGAAMLVERLDNVFHSPDELKEATKLPVLGVIPYHKNLGKNPADGETNQREANKRSRRNRNAYGYHYFPFLESFRSLYTNIGFLGSDTPIHSLVISSSVHADGKSTVAAYLAQAAAAMGRKVLLVDADLRLPQVHRILNLSNDTGLSNAISTNVPVADLIQRSPAWENLFILTAGQIPPDPTKLLSSHKMRNIMEQLRQQYDLVIYDTPPLLGLADASLLAPLTAGIAIVTRMDKTDRAMLTQTLDQLKLSRTQVLGAICNGVKDYKATTSYYHYYYQPRTQSAG